MATGSLSPVGRQLFWDTTLNQSLASGFVLTLISGTSTQTPTYTDAGLSIPNANPIALDSTGTATIYLDPGVGAYKFQVKNAASVLLYTEDPVTATNAGTAGLGQIFVFGGRDNVPVTVTTYPAGTTGDTLIAGSSQLFVDSATLTAGTYVIEATGQVTSGNTLTVAIMDLDDGAPNTPLQTVNFTTQVPTFGRSGAITFAAGGTAKHYGIKAQVSAGTGFVSNVKLWRTA